MNQIDCNNAIFRIVFAFNTNIISYLKTPNSNDKKNIIYNN